MEELKEIISGEQPSTQELQSKFSLLNSSLTLTHKENRNKRRSISRSYLDIIDQLGVDADGNGTIDLEEFTQMMKLLGIYTETEIAKPKQLLPVAPKRLSLQKDKPKSDWIHHTNSIQTTLFCLVFRNVIVIYFDTNGTFESNCLITLTKSYIIQIFITNKQNLFDKQYFNFYNPLFKLTATFCKL